MQQPKSRGSVRAAWIAAALTAVVVIPLGLLAGTDWEPLIEVDMAVGDELVVPGRGTDVGVLRFLTELGGAAVRLAVLVALAGWLAWRRRWRLVAFVVASGALVGPLNELLKASYNRPRPPYDTVDTSGFSYPSGHAAGAAATATVLVVVFWPVLSRPWRLLLLGLAITVVTVVGYTRVALGAHFASDVVAGWCVGVAWAVLLAVVLHVWPGQPAALSAPRGR